MLKTANFCLNAPEYPLAKNSQNRRRELHLGENDSKSASNRLYNADSAPNWYNGIPKLKFERSAPGKTGFDSLADCPEAVSPARH